jgi:phosphohistidine phosphatase
MSKSVDKKTSLKTVQLDKYTLILARHSKAEPSNYIDDYNRELIPSGRKRAVNLGEQLLNLDIVPDFILSSKASRALQTAQCIAKPLVPDLKIHTSKSLYLIRENEMLEKLRNKLEGNVALVVGHAPTIGVLAYLLSKNPIHSESLSTAQAVILTSNEPFDSWHFAKQRAVIVLKGVE